MFHARFATNCLAALWLFAPAMHASIITFVATGVTQSGSTLSGDVVINTTTGSVSSLSLTMSSPLSFTANTLDSIDTGPASGFYVIEARNGTTFPFISLDIPTATLVGYTGGSMCTVGSTCPNGISFSEASSTSNATTSGFVSGSLTASPEPSSLAWWVARCSVWRHGGDAGAPGRAISAHAFRGVVSSLAPRIAEIPWLVPNRCHRRQRWHLRGAGVAHFSRRNTGHPAGSPIA